MVALGMTMRIQGWRTLMALPLFSRNIIRIGIERLSGTLSTRGLIAANIPSTEEQNPNLKGQAEEKTAAGGRRRDKLVPDLVIADIKSSKRSLGRIQSRAERTDSPIPLSPSFPLLFHFPSPFLHPSRITFPYCILRPHILLTPLSRSPLSPLYELTSLEPAGSISLSKAIAAP
ncbi:uncharacterized protein LDX57_004344 [Aspergillus melleus]|uniref:uncharacterized protein n=1 Tax=Aspergillus melleus TaxID=138277 RepID=UPI001E8E4C24|nr:uncharacterized protein LDX57_004344 [Aspergillus melleus]KAH8426609.1 hypothetical protein LDX57_004344 [Aspergillus melleus]